MDSRLVRSQYDWESKRAYVELRAPEGDTEVIVSVMFTVTPPDKRKVDGHDECGTGSRLPVRDSGAVPA
jgi:hypothetical protein